MVYRVREMIITETYDISKYRLFVSVHTFYNLSTEETETVRTL